MKQKSSIKKITLKAWYDDLPASEQKPKRESIQFLLGIQKNQFYRLLNGERSISPAEQAALNGLAGVELHFEGSNLTANVGLVKA